MLILDEDIATFFYPISVLLIKKEDVKYIIDQRGFLIDVEVFLAEASKLGWYYGHVAPIEISHK